MSTMMMVAQAQIAQNNAALWTTLIIAGLAFAALGVIFCVLGKIRGRNAAIMAAMGILLAVFSGIGNSVTNNALELNQNSPTNQQAQLLLEQ